MLSLMVEFDNTDSWKINGQSLMANTTVAIVSEEQSVWDQFWKMMQDTKKQTVLQW